MNKLKADFTDSQDYVTGVTPLSPLPEDPIDDTLDLNSLSVMDELDIEGDNSDSGNISEMKEKGKSVS